MAYRKHSPPLYITESQRLQLIGRPCAGPAYPNHSKPCPDNIYVVTGKGWCRKCLPRTNIA